MQEDEVRVHFVQACLHDIYCTTDSSYKKYTAHFSNFSLMQTPYFYLTQNCRHYKKKNFNLNNQQHLYQCLVMAQNKESAFYLSVVQRLP